MNTDLAGDHLDGTCDCGTFYLDAAGAYSRDKVPVNWSDQPRATNDEVESLIDQAWGRAIEQARQRGKDIYNGRLCRLVGYNTESGKIALTLGHVSFKEFVGTNQTQAYVRYFHGADVLADPLGVSAVIISADGFILLGRRSHRVLQYSKRIHPIGGVVECGQSSQLPHPFEIMLNELREETNVATEKVTELTLLGLVRDKHTVQPELIFDLCVSAGLEEIIQSAKDAPDAHEHVELMAFKDHPGATVTFIQQHFSELTPVALAALLLHGLRHWGSGWFAAARGYLQSVV